MLGCAAVCIPRRRLQERKSTHPWLNDKVGELVRLKNEAQGIEDEKDAAVQGTALLRRQRRSDAQPLPPLPLEEAIFKWLGRNGCDLIFAVAAVEHQ